MRNTGVFDGFGTAALTECPVSVYPLASVGLGEAPLLSSCPPHLRYHQQGTAEETELLPSMLWARVLIC